MGFFDNKKEALILSGPANYLAWFAITLVQFGKFFDFFRIIARKTFFHGPHRAATFWARLIIKALMLVDWDSAAAAVDRAIIDYNILRISMVMKSHDLPPTLCVRGWSRIS